jgi:hypothetical protein
VEYDNIINDDKINDIEESKIVTKVHDSSCYELFAERNKLYDRKRQLQSLLAQMANIVSEEKMSYDNELVLVNKEIQIYEQILLQKNIIDSNGNVIIHEDSNLTKDDHCYSLKKLLQNSNSDCSNVHGFNSQGEFVSACNPDVLGDDSLCNTYNYDCMIINNDDNNQIKSKSFCTPYNISSINELSDENSKNKFINITTEFPNNRYGCFNNEITNSMDFASKIQMESMNS